MATRFEGLPDVHYGNGEHFVDAAAESGISKWTLTGTANDGTRKEVRGCDFYTFRMGKVIRKDSYWKMRCNPRQHASTGVDLRIDRRGNSIAVTSCTDARCAIWLTLQPVVLQAPCAGLAMSGKFG